TDRTLDAPPRQRQPVLLVVDAKADQEAGYAFLLELELRVAAQILLHLAGDDLVALGIRQVEQRLLVVPGRVDPYTLALRQIAQQRDALLRRRGDQRGP